MDELRLDPVLGLEAPQLLLDRRDEAVVVERGRAQLAGKLEELLHRLVREPLRLRELVPQPRRRDLRERLEPQQDRGQRLVDLVVEVARDALALLLLGAQLQPACAPPLGLDPLEQLRERVREPLDLLDRLLRRLERRRARSGRSPRSRGSARRAG